jgi:hypothetical protein
VVICCQRILCLKGDYKCVCCSTVAMVMLLRDFVPWWIIFMNVCCKTVAEVILDREFGLYEITS